MWVAGQQFSTTPRVLRYKGERGTPDKHSCSLILKMKRNYFRRKKKAKDTCKIYGPNIDLKRSKTVRMSAGPYFQK